MLSRFATPIGLGTIALLLAGTDLVLGIRGVLSHAFTLAEIVLVLPWLSSIRHPLPAGGVGRREEPPALWKRIVTALVPTALILACLASKWSVLGHASSLGAAPFVAAYRTYAAIALFTSLVGLVGAYRVELFLAKMADHPARLMLLSFGLLAAVGGVLLTLPQAVTNPANASLVDGLFTATSAVCVTGLSVNVVSQAYAPFGQVVILVLIQIGGLGVMVLSAFFAIVVGQRMQAKATAVMAEMIDADSFTSFRRTVITIVVATLVTEAVGALLLWGLFSQYHDAGMHPDEPFPLAGPRDVRWAAVFHAVSAFCNAGFSIFRDGLAPLVGSPGVNLVIAALIVIGGIGFPVLDELLQHLVARIRRRRAPRLSLHARVVLSTSAALTAAGAIALLPLEWSASMRELPVHQKVMAALFQSIALRTAGFNTVDFGQMRAATLVLACALMLIGGSPGSTAGGIKTTTAFVLFSSLRAELAGLVAPRAFGRTFGMTTVRRATALAFLSVLIVSGVVLVLLLVEPHEPHRLLFEAVSAFGTVGYSTNLTPLLSVPGKLVVTATMFIGRIGPMTLMLALASREAKVPVELPEERVGIG